MLCFSPIYSNFQSFENLVSPTSQIDDNFPVFKPIFNFSKKLTRLSFSSKQMFFYQTNRLPFLSRIYFSLKQDWTFFKLNAILMRPLPDKWISTSFKESFLKLRLNFFQNKRDSDAPLPDKWMTTSHKIFFL